MAEQKIGAMKMASDEVTNVDNHLLVHLPSGNLTIAQRIPPQPKSHIICYSCKVMLEFVSGPKQIRCTRCNSVNRVPESTVSKEKCQNCRVLLQFPKSSKKVKCGSCKYINDFSGLA